MLLGGCVVQQEDQVGPVTHSLEEAVIADAFAYRTTSDVALEITAADNQNHPLRGVSFSVGYVAEDQWVEVGRGVTAAEGSASVSASVPAWVEEVVVRSNYVGLPHEHSVKVQPGVNSVIIGGASTATARTGAASQSYSLVNARTAAGPYTYLSGYDADGVPDNLLPEDDYISQDILDLVNNSLPESYPVPTYNSHYLDDKLVTDVQLSAEAEVWITFVHEGAGWRNALGFYTYELSRPPQTVEDISELKIIFPNVSFAGGGGNLTSGNKVSLGTYPANTGIGWFLVPNAWNGTEVTQRSGVKYSNKDFNTFTSEEYRQHTVLLKDEVREILLLGIEDTSRPGGDNDFNDAVFYVSANPFDAIITDQLEETQTSGNDRDNDGVADLNDAYPDDVERAFDVFSPGSGLQGSVAFEDNWPQRGDYDMNDVVVDYQYQLITNAGNQVVEMIANFDLVATGASYDNGFGLALPIEAALVRSATLTGTTFSGSRNPMEEGQDRAVFILFEDAHAELQADGPVNTVPSKEMMVPVSFRLQIVFEQAISASTLGYAPYDPFIFIDHDRTREVHLPDFAPTAKGNTQLFGSGTDTSNPSSARYYKSETNLPWALHLPVKFDYPAEYSAINLAHLQFVRWAESSGTQYKDWYQENNGYRKPEKIYTKQ